MICSHNIKDIKRLHFFFIPFVSSVKISSCLCLRECVESGDIYEVELERVVLCQNTRISWQNYVLFAFELIEQQAISEEK